METKHKLFIAGGVIIIAIGGWFATKEKDKNLDVADQKPANVSEEPIEDVLEDLFSFKEELSFDHVKPGEYSEVYLTITGGIPGETLERTLYGPGVLTVGTQSVVVDDEGNAKFTWSINRFGTYTATQLVSAGSVVESMDEVEVGQIVVQ